MTADQDIARLAEASRLLERMCDVQDQTAKVLVAAVLLNRELTARYRRVLNMLEDMCNWVGGDAATQAHDATLAERAWVQKVQGMALAMEGFLSAVGHEEMLETAKREADGG